MFMKPKILPLIAQIAIILAVLGSSEPFDRIDISSWVMVICLGLLLVFYFLVCTVKLKYIPRFDFLIALCSAMIWVVLLFTVDYWSNITGWDRLIYAIYPLITGIFIVCLLVMNIIIHVIKSIRRK